MISNLESRILEGGHFGVPPKESATSYVCACTKLPWSHATKAAQWLGATIVLFLVCLLMFSQTSQGTIQGGVFDQTGGAIAGAMVTLTDVACGLTRALTTDSTGEFVATSLDPGTYTVRAEAKGLGFGRAPERRIRRIAATQPRSKIETGPP